MRPIRRCSIITASLRSPIWMRCQRASISSRATVPLAKGGIATMHDSGGFRELVMDLGDREPACRLPRSTMRRRAKLAARLDYGLEPINPLDAWGTGNDWEGIFEDCLQALVDDPDTAMASLCVETRDGYYSDRGLWRHPAPGAGRAPRKPVILTTNVASNAKRRCRACAWRMTVCRSSRASRRCWGWSRR